MTNGAALAILIGLAAVLALDHWVLHLGIPLVLARKGLDLIDALALWR